MARRLLALLAWAMLSAAVSAQVPPDSSEKPDITQEGLVYERIENLVRFETDGSGLRDTAAVIRVQTQAGVKQLGQLVVGYSSATETLDIDYVRVRKPDGKVIETPTSTAQDFAPEILREAPMYSDYRERHLSVSWLQAGDVLEYHYITHVKPLAPGQFWYEHRFPKQFAVQQERLRIDVPKSRVLKLKSPDYKYDTQETGERRIYTWTIKDFTPDRDPDRDQDELDESDFGPHVQLTSFKDWDEVAHWYAKLQGDRVSDDTAIRAKAAELTKGASTPSERARKLYDYVALNIRYVSLSFGVGRLQPHSAAEVLQNGYGDCKDKHTLLQALLRVDNIQSYPVLINSFRKLDVDVPSPGQFDHVITAVKFAEKWTWLDTTAEVAPYGLILYQLRNKEALLSSDDANAGLRRTPADSPVKNLEVMKFDGNFTETGALNTTIDLTAQGDSDVPLRAAFRLVPPADRQRVLQYLSNAWGLKGDISDVRLDSVEDTGKPFHMSYHFHEDNYFKVPSSGASFQVLPLFATPRAGNSRKKGSEPIDVGPAVERIYRAHISFPPTYTIHVPSSVQMTRDYGEYTVSYTVNKNALEGERHLVLKVNELPASRRSDYDSFHTVTTRPAEQGLWCSITPASGGSVSAANAAAKTTGTPKEMHKAASAALERNDFATAVDLLKRAADQDASQKDVWEDLGQAYAGLNQRDEAIHAFQKQMELDPYHPRASGDLAVELQKQGRSEDAIVAYKKQIEIAPSEKSAHKNLGLLLAQMKRDADAQAELEIAASIPPDDPELKMALADIYSRTGHADKAEALRKSVTGSSSATAGTDMFSSALRDDIDPNQTIHDARQTLADIGDQFDSGEYNRLGPSAFSAMNLVALAWARIGWAKFLQGQLLDSLQYLNSSWMLSQSGAVAYRLGRVLQKETQRDKARHMFALAAALGGSDAKAAREEVLKLATNPAAADKEIGDATSELLRMRTIKLPATIASAGSAQFAFVFDSSNQPERAEYLDGDPALRGAGDKLLQTDYPVKFPDVSSVKIIRRGTLSCGNGGCALVLLPLEGLQTSLPPSTAAGVQNH